VQQKVPDQDIWHLTKSGSYTSKSAYNAYFLGSTKFVPYVSQNLGPRCVVSSIFSWQSKIGAGLQIVWLKEGCHIPMLVLFVIKKMRQFSMF
jgi:hypothetical protein